MDYSGPFKDAVEKAVFENDIEKTKHDKLNATKSMERIKSIFSKPTMTYEDVNEVQNLLASDEVKKATMERMEKYLHHKYYLVIGMYARRYMKAIRADQEYEKIWDTLDPRVQGLRSDIQKDYALQYKELVNNLLFGIRSSVSVGGKMLEMIAKEHKEYEYTGNIAPIPVEQIKR